METKTKTFDCVEMKNRAQAALLAEYDAREDREQSLIQFVHETNARSPWIRMMRERLGVRGTGRLTEGAEDGGRQGRT